MPRIEESTGRRHRGRCNAIVPGLGDTQRAPPSPYHVICFFVEPRIVTELHRAGLEELKPAQSLIDSMSTTIDQIPLENRCTEAAREMTDVRIAGEEFVVVEEEPKEVVDIMTALKQSIGQARSTQKCMQRTGKKPVCKKATKKKAKADSTSKKAARKKGSGRWAAASGREKNRGGQNAAEGTIEGKGETKERVRRVDDRTNAAA